MAFDLTPGFDLGIWELNQKQKSSYNDDANPIPEWKLMGYADEGAYKADMGMAGYDKGLDKNAQNKDIYNNRLPSYSQTKGTTSTYNLNNAIANAANSEMAKTKKMWESLYQNGLVSLDEMNAGINADRMTISNQLAALNKGYDTRKKGLKAQLSNTLQGQNSYFGAISPEAYQSQQGVYAGEAQKTYDEGLADLDAELKANKAIQANALAQTEAQQAKADAYQNALKTYAAEGGIEPTKPSISRIKPQYVNKDLSKHYEKFANLYLANTLTGMTKEQNKKNIRESLAKQGLEPDLQEYLYSQIFPEDYQNTYYPTASDYAMLNDF